MRNRARDVVPTKVERELSSFDLDFSTLSDKTRALNVTVVLPLTPGSAALTREEADAPRSEESASPNRMVIFQRLTRAVFGIRVNDSGSRCSLASALKEVSIPWGTR